MEQLASFPEDAVEVTGLPDYARRLAVQLGHDRLSEVLRAMRPPAEIMTAEALRLTKATSFSFARWFIDRLCDERWSIERVHCRIEANGEGLVVYRVEAAGRVITFATRTRAFVEEERTGRLRDNEFDFYSALYDADVDLARIERESEEQIRKAWRGRTDNTSLGWTFANRSNRQFEMIIEALAEGRQPDVEALAAAGGYVIRNAGFYGNGRHGCRTWSAFGSDHPLSDPYHVDMFCIYMWRQIGFDFIEGMAKARSPHAVPLDPAIKRYLGVGNSSGIGMSAALVRWPNWLSGFAFTREFALAFALTDREAAHDTLRRVDDLLSRASDYYRETAEVVPSDIEDRRLIAEELAAVRAIAEELRKGGATLATPVLTLMQRVRSSFSPQTAEQVAALIVDARPDLVQRLRPPIVGAMALHRDIVPAMSLPGLKTLIEKNYRWALDLDLTGPGTRHYFWYRSEENGENRRGEREIDPGVEFETFMDVAGTVQALYARLLAAPANWTVARYLVEEPDDLYMISRVQFLRELPYGEVQANIIARTFKPSDLIQHYLTVLGMETTVPVGPRWVRGVFVQGAPLPDEIARGEGRDWALPRRPAASDAGRAFAG